MQSEEGTGEGEVDATVNVNLISPPPPQAHRQHLLVAILAMFRVLVQERNSHLIVLIAYRIAQLALGFYSFYYPMALFAPMLDYVVLFEGWTVFKSIKKAGPSLRRTVIVIAVVFTLVCVLDYSVFGRA